MTSRELIRELREIIETVKEEELDYAVELLKDLAERVDEIED
jgi:hypothetical protein